jgi:hypothetical protein
MGYTRSRRYANHKSGRKYRINPQLANSPAAETAARKNLLPLDIDPLKARSAEIFKAKWQQAKNNVRYQQLLQKVTNVEF